MKYLANGLDHASESREDTKLIAEFWQQDNCRITLHCEGKQLFQVDTQSADKHYLLTLLSRAQLSDAMAHSEPWIFLGHYQEQPIFALDIAPELAQNIDSQWGEFAILRDVSGNLDEQHGTLAATTLGLMYWHQQHRFCSNCGNPTTSIRAGHVRRCNSCHKLGFPRTDPAVIMLVERYDPVLKEKVCLLGRNARYQRPIFSTLAGFVEIGESLEQAVAREVMEEVGVLVDDVSYVTSQPWPFPSSLMFGYRATSSQVDIHIDANEICDARWFTLADLEQCCEPEQATEQCIGLPNRDSISRFLIQQWIEEQRA